MTNFLCNMGRWNLILLLTITALPASARIGGLKGRRLVNRRLQDTIDTSIVKDDVGGESAPNSPVPGPQIQVAKGPTLPPSKNHQGLGETPTSTTNPKFPTTPIRGPFSPRPPVVGLPTSNKPRPQAGETPTIITAAPVPISLATPAPVPLIPTTVLPPVAQAPVPFIPTVKLPPIAEAPVPFIPTVKLPPIAEAPVPFIPTVKLPPFTPAPVPLIPTVNLPPVTPAPVTFIPTVNLPPVTPDPVTFIPTVNLPPVTPAPVTINPTMKLPLSTPAPVHMIPTGASNPVTLAPSIVPTIATSPVTPAPSIVPPVAITPSINGIPFTSQPVSPSLTDVPSTVALAAPVTSAPITTLPVVSDNPSFLVSVAPTLAAPEYSSTAPSPNLIDAAIDCKGIASGNATTSDNLAEFRVNFDLVIEANTTLSFVTEAVRRVLQESVAPQLAGCRDRRQLLDSETYVTNVQFSAPDPDVTASCSAPSSDSACYVTDIPTTIYYTGTDTDDFEARLTGAVVSAEENGLFDGIDGYVDIRDVWATQEGGVSEIAGATSGTSSDGSFLSGGAIAAVALAGAGLLLTLVIVAMRRRSDERGSEEIKYLEHEDDESYDIDGATLRSSDGHSPMQTRVLVGDDDSVASGWSEFSPYHGVSIETIVDDLSTMDSKYQRKNGMRQHTELPPCHCDTLFCTSALCDTCELQRQQGPIFIPVGNIHAPLERLPSDAKRAYFTKDTVDL